MGSKNVRSILLVKMTKNPGAAVVKADKSVTSIMYVLGEKHAELSRPVLSTKIIKHFSHVSRITKQCEISVNCCLHSF